MDGGSRSCTGGGDQLQFAAAGTEFLDQRQAPPVVAVENRQQRLGGFVVLADALEGLVHAQPDDVLETRPIVVVGEQVVAEDRLHLGAAEPWAHQHEDEQALRAMPAP